MELLLSLQLQLRLSLRNYLKCRQWLQILQGPYESLGTGISTVLTKSMGIQVKVMTTNGPQEFYPMMKDNQADLGIENNWDAVSGWKGVSTYGPISDNKGFDVRLVVSGNQVIDQLIVANNSDIKTGADLKGKKVVTTISSSPGMTLFVL